jgi:hypothetical protein
LVHGASELKDEYKFDAHLLYKWRCNLFTQDNWDYSNKIEAIKLCNLDDWDTKFTNPMKYSQWMASEKLDDKAMKIIKEFSQSPY